MSWAIGIDFGTSRSAGAIGELDPRRLAPDPITGAVVSPLAAPSVSPLEIEGNRWIPSMVLRTPEGELVVGAAADNLAGVHPDRLERTPKRALGTASPLLLGGTPVDPRDAAAAVIRTIVAEGRLRAGSEPAGCIITHPVRWAGVRRAALAEAAGRAGLGEVQLVDEPVAAAIHYASEHVALGAKVGVYDLGGGTFDTALLQRTDRGFEVIGVPGGDEHIGGEDFDHRLFRYFGSCLAETDAELWEQLMTSDDRKWKRAALDLLVQARRAKEALSSYTSTQVFVPIADRDIVINRSQFEAMIIDDVERTMELMEDSIIEAGVKVEDLSAVFLVGGSSRVPLVSQMATERFGTRVVTRDEPKGVVALGAARLAALRFLGPKPATKSSTAAPTPGGVAATPEAGTAWLNALPVPQLSDRLAVEPPPPDTTPAVAADAPWASAPPPTATAYPLPTAAHTPAGTAPAPSPAPSAPTAPLWNSAPAPSAPAAPAAADDLAAMPPPSAPPPLSPSHAASLARAMAAPPSPAAPTAPAPAAASAAPNAAVTVAWRLALGEAPGQLAADVDAVVLAGLGGLVRCVDPRRGEQRWQVAIGSPSWCAPALAHDSVAVGSSNGQVTLLDRVTGVRRWAVSVGAAIVCAPAIVGNLVVVGHDGGSVVGLERTTGTVRWTLPVGSAVRAGIVAAGSDVIVATAAGQVFSVHVDTGRPRWGYRTGGQILLTPGVVGDRVLVPSRDGLVHGLHLADGTALWGVRCAGGPATPVATAGGLFAVVDEQGGLRVHRADTGQVHAEATVGGTGVAGVVLVPTAAPTVAVVETGGELLAVDLATRVPRFSLPTGDGNRSVPVVSGGLVCVGTAFGQLYGVVAP